MRVVDLGQPLDEGDPSSPGVEGDDTEAARKARLRRNRSKEEAEVDLGFRGLGRASIVDESMSTRGMGAYDIGRGKMDVVGEEREGGRKPCEIGASDRSGKQQGMRPPP